MRIPELKIIAVVTCQEDVSIVKSLDESEQGYQNIIDEIYINESLSIEHHPFKDDERTYFWKGIDEIKINLGL